MFWATSVQKVLPSPTLEKKKPFVLLQSKYFLFSVINSRLTFLQKWWYAPCVFSMNYVYEDFGDVDTYIDSCDDYMKTIASALTLVVILEL